MMGGNPGGRIDAEMHVHDGAEFARGIQSRHDRGGHHRRHCQDDGVILAERNLVIAKIERGHPHVSEIERTQAASEIHHRIALGKKLERRLDERRPQSIARDQGPAGRPAGKQRLADDRAG
jgi:hypothetical protein